MSACEHAGTAMGQRVGAERASPGVVCTGRATMPSAGSSDRPRVAVSRGEAAASPTRSSASAVPVASVGWLPSVVPPSSTCLRRWSSAAGSRFPPVTAGVIGVASAPGIQQPAAHKLGRVVGGSGRLGVCVAHRRATTAAGARQGASGAEDYPRRSQRSARCPGSRGGSSRSTHSSMSPVTGCPGV
jgi:hypothetical protein